MTTIMRRESPTSKTGRPNGQTKEIQDKKRLMMSNPGVWFVYKEEVNHAASGGVRATLMGVRQSRLTPKFLGGQEPWQVSSRKLSNGKYRVYTRYIGENHEYKD